MIYWSLLLKRKLNKFKIKGVKGIGLEIGIGRIKRVGNLVRIESISREGKRIEIGNRNIRGDLKDLIEKKREGKEEGRDNTNHYHHLLAFQANQIHTVLPNKRTRSRR